MKVLLIFNRSTSEIRTQEKSNYLFILIYGVLEPFEVGFIIRTVGRIEEASYPLSSGIKLIQRDRLVKLTADLFKEGFTGYLFKLGESFLTVAVDAETSHGDWKSAQKINSCHIHDACRSRACLSCRRSLRPMQNGKHWKMDFI